MSNPQVGEFINAHKRLENPDRSTIERVEAGVKLDYLFNCLTNLYEICFDCWNHEVRSSYTLFGHQLLAATRLLHSSRSSLHITQTNNHPTFPYLRDAFETALVPCQYVLPDQVSGAGIAAPDLNEQQLRPQATHHILRPSHTWKNFSCKSLAQV